MERIAFIKTGWAITYEGDEVVGRHAHIGEYDEAHERFNFRRAPDGRFYGYAPPLGKYESCPKPQEQDGWLLILVAARNGDGPLTVVGYYENARFEREYVDRPEYAEGDFELDVHGNRYSFCFSASNATLIPLHLRQQTVSSAHYRRSSVIYAAGNGQDDAWRDEFAELALRIVASPPPEDRESPALTFPDAARRKAVEQAAIDLAIKTYKKEYRITDRQSDCCGYDLLLVHKKTGEELHLEVKGTGGDLRHFFMSRNEQRYVAHPCWRLFMVTDALAKPRGSLMTLWEVTEAFDLIPFAWEGVAKQR
jgi:hypothetical protein